MFAQQQICLDNFFPDLLNIPTNKVKGPLNDFSSFPNYAKPHQKDLCAILTFTGGF